MSPDVELGWRPIARRALARGMRIPHFREAVRGASRLTVLPPSIWRRLPVEGEFVIRDEGLEFVYVSEERDQIGRALYWRGLAGFEPETVEAFLPLVRKVDTFVDVGANSGFFTLLGAAANPLLHVLAFEPVPRVRKALSRNVQRNGFGERCDIRAEAVSNEAREVTFHVPDGDLPSSASLNVNGFRGIAGETIRVSSTTLDAALPAAARSVLVKIDVEGFEDRVLEGMARILRDLRPALIVECNPDGPIALVEQSLVRHGYRFYWLRPNGPEEKNRIEPDQLERARNYLCLPVER